MKNAGMRKWFENLIRKIYQRHGVAPKTMACLEYLYPTIPREERELAFLREKIKKMALVSLLGAVALLLAALTFQKSAAAPLMYDRNAYGEEDEQITLEVRTQNESGELQTEAEVTIPAKEISQEEATIALGEAQQTLLDLVASQTLWEDFPAFPEECGDVSISYYSLSSSIVDDSFSLVGDWPEEETVVSVQACFSIGGYHSEATYAFSLMPAGDLSLTRKVELTLEKLVRGDYLGADALTLPEEGTGGVQLNWSTTATGASVGGLLAAGLLVLVILWFYWDERLQKQKQKQQEEIRNQLTEFIQELLLLVGAGMSVPNAWFHYALKNDKSSQKEALRTEIELTKQAHDGGKSFTEILNGVMARTPVQELAELCSLLMTSARLGNATLLKNLAEMNRRLWEDKKNRAKEASAGANTKLLLPIMLMLVVVLGVTMAPALMNMQSLGG